MNTTRRLGALLAVTALPLTACGGASSGGTAASTSATSVGTAAAASTTSGPGKSAPASKPAGSGSSAASTTVPTTAAVRLSIPSIGLDHSVVGGGLSGGVLSPPPGNVIQFTGYHRVIPGQNGIAVLAGHVTYSGPDVFYALHDVAPGAAITITYGDGTTKKFVATDKASVNKDQLQNDPRVWGSSSTPVLALVTCDASSAWVNAEHHANNYVVWARPA